MTTVKKPLRVYADTSVFGGCFDDEFRNESVRFFEEVRLGQFVVVVSNVTLDELELAPDRVRGVLADLPPQQVEIVNTSLELDGLRNANLEAAMKAGKAGKDFDCVEMKAEIQQRLLREVAELGEEEAQRRRAQRLLRDPILGGFLRTKMTNGKRPAEHTRPVSPAV